MTSSLPSKSIAPVRQPTAKELRTLDRLIKQVHGKNGVMSPRNFEELKLVEKFGGEVFIEGRQAFLTKVSINALRAICAEFEKLVLPNNLFVESDIWTSLLKLNKKNLSEKFVPTPVLLLKEVLLDIAVGVGDFTYVADFEGIELHGLREISGGRIKVVPPDDGVLLSFRRLVTSDEKCRELLKQPAWLMGKYLGTETATRSRFELDAILTAGIFGLIATICYDNGFQRSRPMVHVKSLDPGGTFRVLRWSGEHERLHLSQGGLRGVPVEINAEMLNYLETECKLKQLFSMVQKDSGNQIEEAVARSVYWFAHAQRDGDRAMRFVKLWSCIESFFAFERHELTERNSMGLATVLAFGGYNVISVDEYSEVKKRVKALYATRSKAIHRAEHRHIDSGSMNDLTYWAAWCIFTFVSLAERGYSSLQQVWKDVERLDSRATSGSKK